MARHARVSLAGMMGALVVAIGAVLIPSDTVSASPQGWTRDRSGGWECIGECSDGQYCCGSEFLSFN